MVSKLTVPRKPISAMVSSPGPVHSLPVMLGHQYHDPRSTVVRQPAYSFGIRLANHTRSVNPGYLHVPEKIYRDGKDGTPHYSITGRRRDLKPFQTPSPANYFPVLDTVFRRQPSFCIGSRNRGRAMDTTPGANVYCISLVDKPRAPIISMKKRPRGGGFAEDLAKSPSPSQYRMPQTDLYRTRSPAFSIPGGPRAIMTTINTQKPQRMNILPKHQSCIKQHTKPPKAQGPMYSFGIRHSQYTVPLIAEPTWD